MTTTENGDQIPFQEVYKGIGIHIDQPPQRVKVVKAAIDSVLKQNDPEKLAKITADASFPPEVRLFACARIEAMFEFAAENRELRPRVNLDKVRASVSGLDSLYWRSPTHYCSDLDLTGAWSREVRLPDPDYKHPPKGLEHVER